MPLFASGLSTRHERHLSLDAHSPSAPRAPSPPPHASARSLPRSVSPHREESPLMHAARTADPPSESSSPVASSPLSPPAAAPAAATAAATAAAATAAAAWSRVTAVLVARTFPGVLDRGKGYALLSSVLDAHARPLHHHHLLLQQSARGEKVGGGGEAGEAAHGTESSAVTATSKDSKLDDAALQAELHLGALAAHLRAPAAEEEPLLLYADAPRAYLVQPAGPDAQAEQEMREMKEQSLRQLEDELDMINELICQEEAEEKEAQEKQAQERGGTAACGDDKPQRGEFVGRVPVQMEGGHGEAVLEGKKGWSASYYPAQNHSQSLHYHQLQQQHQGHHTDPVLCSHPLQALLPELQEGGEEAAGGNEGGRPLRCLSELDAGAAPLESSEIHHNRSLSAKSNSDVFPKRLGSEWGKVLRKGWSVELLPGSVATLTAAAALGGGTTATAETAGCVGGAANAPGGSAGAAGGSDGMENQDPKLLSRPSHPHYQHLLPATATATSPSWSHHLGRSLKLNPDLSRVSPAESFPSDDTPHASFSFSSYLPSSSTPGVAAACRGESEVTCSAAAGSGTEGLAAAAAAAAARRGVEGGEGREQNSGEVRRQFVDLISRWTEGPLAAAAALGGRIRGGEGSWRRAGGEGDDDAASGDVEDARVKRGNSGSMFGLGRRMRGEEGSGGRGGSEAPHRKKQGVCEITEEVSGSSSVEAAADAESEAAAAAAACSVLAAAMRGVQPDPHMILPHTAHTAQQQQEQQHASMPQQQQQQQQEAERVMVAEIHSLLTGLQQHKGSKSLLMPHSPGTTLPAAQAAAGEGMGRETGDGVKDAAVYIDVGEEPLRQARGASDAHSKNSLAAGARASASSRRQMFYKCAIVTVLIGIIVCACFFIGWIAPQQNSPSPWHRIAHRLLHQHFRLDKLYGPNLPARNQRSPQHYLTSSSRSCPFRTFRCVRPPPARAMTGSRGRGSVGAFRARSNGAALLPLVAVIVLGSVLPVAPSTDAPTLHGADRCALIQRQPVRANSESFASLSLLVPLPIAKIAYPACSRYPLSTSFPPFPARSSRVPECDSSDPLHSPLARSADHARRYHRPPHLCWSKAEIPCYAGSHGMAERSETLKRKLRAYHEYRRDCDAKENITSLKSKLRGANATQCKYLLWHFSPGDGQGNQYISLVSAFVYALLTNRVFLLLTERGPGKLMCQPFEGAPWFVFSDVKGELWDAEVLHIKLAYPYFQERVKAMQNGTSDTMPLPNVANINLQHNMANTSIFFCESEQQWLARVPSLLLRSNQYFLPALLYHPSFRRHIRDLFPSGRIFQTVSQLIMFPNNRLWAAITDNIHHRVAPAAARVGLQLRQSSEGIIAQAAECIVQVMQGDVVAAARREREKGDGEREAGVEPGGVGAGGGGVGEEGEGGAAVGGGGGALNGTGEATAYGMGVASEEGTAAALAVARALEVGGAPAAAAAAAAEAARGGESGSMSDSGGGVSASSSSTVVLIAALNEFAPYNLSLLLFPNASSSPPLTYTKIVVTDSPDNATTDNSTSAAIPTSTGTTTTTATTTNSSNSNITSSSDAALDLTPVSTVASIPPSSSTITNSTIISNGTFSLDRLTTETSQTGLDAELQHAIIDIYTVALASDTILVFPASTFGYLLSSLFGRPAFFAAKTCQEAPLEPCYHHPPQPHQCPGGLHVGGPPFNESDPELPFARCPDASGGLLLLYKRPP
ncbi:unnamed protein product [Closterium sp. Yama58-4]|nr:unnamed protein product [Closterium sp. Yama58-4]